MSLKITSYCRITNDSCFLNGELFFALPKNTEDSLTKALYKHLEISYPKFYKMDILSKYGFLASEVLIAANKRLKTYKDDAVALLFANSNSSTLTDLKYQETIETEKPSPSPSLFVYTLPNILLGEIAIRNKWFGENMFFILPTFDVDFLKNYTEVLFKNKEIEACIIAWVDVKNNKNDVLLFSIEKSKKNALGFNVNKLKEIYNS